VPAAQSPDKYRIIVRERAWLALRRATHWYEQRNTVAAARFVMAIDNAVASLAEAPLRWALWMPDVRRCLLPGFPYSPLYRVVGTQVQVLAVVHHARHPDTWRAGT
jgi:plasmid stabilization system protein ParE